MSGRTVRTVRSIAPLTAPAPRRLIDLTEDELRELVKTAVLDTAVDLASGKPSEPSDGLLDRRGACKVLGCSSSKLDQLCRDEADPVPYIRLGEVKRFERAALLEWARRQGK